MASFISGASRDQIYTNVENVERIRATQRTPPYAAIDVEFSHISP